MTNLTPSERHNDARLITPLILMALIIACGFLFFSWRGEPAPPHVAQAPTQTTK